MMNKKPKVIDHNLCFTQLFVACIFHCREMMMEKLAVLMKRLSVKIFVYFIIRSEFTRAILFP